MIKSNPVAWRADRASTDTIRAGPCGLISWNGGTLMFQHIPSVGITSEAIRTLVQT